MEITILHSQLKCGKKGNLTGQQMYCMPQRLKSTFLKKFEWSDEKISKNIDFSL